VLVKIRVGDYIESINLKTYSSVDPTIMSKGGGSNGLIKFLTKKGAWSEDVQEILQEKQYGGMKDENQTILTFNNNHLAFIYVCSLW
jgi:hypothetical protein